MYRPSLIYIEIKNNVNKVRNTAENLGHKPCGRKTKPLKKKKIRFLTQFSKFTDFGAPQGSKENRGRELKKVTSEVKSAIDKR